MNMEKSTLVNPLNISALVQGPGAVETDLVIAGFFVHKTDEPELIGGAKGLNDGLKGLVMKYRTDGSFSGKVGKTFLFKTPQNTIPAKNVMLIGLGERHKFSLESMRTVGCMALRNAVAHSFHDIAFAPEVRDAGVTTFPAGDVAEAFTEGAMNEYRAIQLKGEADIQIHSFRILAGPVHETEAIEGITKALQKYQNKDLATGDDGLGILPGTEPALPANQVDANQ